VTAPTLIHALCHVHLSIRGSCIPLYGLASFHGRMTSMHCLPLLLLLEIQRTKKNRTYSHVPVMMMRREVREKYNHPKLQCRPLVYYCGPQPEHLTNTAFNLAVYLMLEHGLTPEAAVRPFLRVTPSPLLEFRDATWMRSTSTVSMLSCLRGLRKALDLALIPNPHSIVDTFDCEEYDICDEPTTFNLNRVSGLLTHCNCTRFLFCGPNNVHILLVRFLSSVQTR
jgi:hypothetical protein